MSGSPAGEDGRPEFDAGPRSVEVEFELGDLPMEVGRMGYPDDLYLDESGRVSVGLPGESLYVQDLQQAIHSRFGFGLRPTCRIRFSGPIDPSSLPRNAEASLADDTAVFLFDADTASPEAFQRIAIELSLDPSGTELRVRPAHMVALEPGRKYALAVTDRLRAESGELVAPSAQLARILDSSAPVRGARERAAQSHYLPVLQTLRTTLLPRGRVVGLSVFRTADVDRDLGDARELVRAQVPEPPSVSALAIGEELDELLGRPEPGRVGLLGEEGAPHEHLRAVLHGRFDAPDFASAEDGVHGAFERTSAGALQLKRRVQVPFTLFLPLSSRAGAVLPVVVAQHGMNGDRGDWLPLANELAASGYAVLAADAPYHGLRGPVGDQYNRFIGQSVPDGFGDGPGDLIGGEDRLGELGALHPFYYRDAARQGVVELFALVHLIESGQLASAVSQQSVLGELRLSTVPTGFVGIDLGAEQVAMLASHEPAAGAIVLAFASGTPVDSWLASPGYGQLVDALAARLMAPVDPTRQELSVRADLDAYRTLTDPASAVAYAPRLRRSTTNVLMWMAADDELVPNAGTEALAEAIGAALVNAHPRFVPELPTAVLRPGSAIRGNFRVDQAKVTRILQFIDGVTHDALVQSQGTRRYQRPLEAPFTLLDAPEAVANPTEALIEQIAFFFESYRACIATSSGPCDAAVHALELD